MNFNIYVYMYIPIAIYKIYFLAQLCQISIFKLPVKPLVVNIFFYTIKNN